MPKQSHRILVYGAPRNGTKRDHPKQVRDSEHMRSIPPTRLQNPWDISVRDSIESKRPSGLFVYSFTCEK